MPLILVVDVERARRAGCKSRMIESVAEVKFEHRHGIEMSSSCPERGPVDF